LPSSPLQEQLAHETSGVTAVGSTLEVRPAQAGESAQLDALVAGHARGTLFHGCGWTRAVQKAFGHAPRTLVAVRDGELVGVLPLMRCRGLLGGVHHVSTPYGVYGGPLGSDEEVEAALVEGALEAARRERVGRLELRSREVLAGPGLTPSDLYVTFHKDLPAEPDEVLSTMKKDERRLVRRAGDTHGLQLAEGDWFLPDLARLFLESKQRLGSPGLPVEWFEALRSELPGRVVTHAVRRGSELLAASMCFVDGPDLRMYYIGTTAEANREYAATSFMIAELQRWAIEHGLTGFDLGRSRKDAGAVKFKRNQGFEPRPLHYAYGLVRSKELPSFTPSNPRTKALRETWSRLPGWMTSKLSARIAAHLF
jgi:FemAB-related protein (PEP-CTERM system-associated)